MPLPVSMTSSTRTHILPRTSPDTRVSRNWKNDIFKFQERGHTLRMTAIFGPFWPPPPSVRKMTSVLLYPMTSLLLILTAILPNHPPLPPRLRSSLKYPPKTATPGMFHTIRYCCSTWCSSFSTQSLAKAVTDWGTGGLSPSTQMVLLDFLRLTDMWLQLCLVMPVSGRSAERIVVQAINTNIQQVMKPSIHEKISNCFIQ